MKPTLLDAFCGAGGATRGYQDAGFYVVGVDINPQPNFCGDEFIQTDAIAFLEAQGHELSPASFEAGEPVPFDAIHASPPCQAYSAATPAESRADHPDLIAETRRFLKQTGLPYVIENVERAPLENPTMLCGSAFGLELRRHRLFETNFPLMAPGCAHGRLEAKFDIYEHGKWRKSGAPAIYGSGGRKAREHWATSLGIDWMSHDEMALAIPPAYTRHVGEFLMQVVRNRQEDRNPVRF